MADTAVEAITLWNNSGTSDKIYSVQLIKTGASGWEVRSQYGPRGGWTKDAPTKHCSSQSQAKREYDELVAKKRTGGYVKPHATIVPSGIINAAGSYSKNSAVAAKEAAEKAAMKLSSLFGGGNKTSIEVEVTENGHMTSALRTLMKGGFGDGTAVIEQTIEVAVETEGVVVEGPKSTGYYPQLLTEIDEELAEKLILDNDWLAQQKVDGTRMIVKWDGKEVTASNKLGKGINVPADLTEEIKLIVPVVLDGEYCDGKLHVFDILQHKDEDLRTNNCEVRMDVLDNLSVVLSENLQALVILPTAFTAGQKKRLFATLKSNNSEGIVFKRKNAVLSEGKANKAINAKGEIVADYLKHKFVKSVDCIVVPAKNGKRAFDCYVYKVLGGPETVSIGSVASGVKDSDMEYLQLEVARGKKVVAEVRYLYATGAGKTTDGSQLYQSAFLRFRDDKPYDQCVLNQLVVTNKAIVETI